MRQITVWSWYIAGVTNPETRSLCGDKLRNVFRYQRSAYHCNAGGMPLSNIHAAPRRRLRLLVAQIAPATAISTGAKNTNQSIELNLPCYLYVSNWARATGLGIVPRPPSKRPFRGLGAGFGSCRSFTGFGRHLNAGTWDIFDVPNHAGERWLLVTPAMPNGKGRWRSMTKAGR